MNKKLFASPSQDKRILETGAAFTPRFDDKGLLPAIATDAQTGDVLMMAWMNEQALALSIETGIAHYWSRSRNQLWKKGETSGNTQKIIEMRTDCDQDVIWMKVEPQGIGAACHVGYKSCFFRVLSTPPLATSQTELQITETAPLFDPDQVYKKKG